jgi:hypothetical protein
LQGVHSESPKTEQKDSLMLFDLSSSEYCVVRGSNSISGNCSLNRKDPYRNNQPMHNLAWS